MRAGVAKRYPNLPAIATMTWDALREQIETPPVIGGRDALSMRVKDYIEAQLADLELSVERSRGTPATFPFVGCTAISPRIQPDPYRAIFGSVGSSVARTRFETRAGRTLDNRRLLLIRLQQFVAFQPAVQGSVRSSAGSLSRRAGLPLRVIRDQC